MPMDRVFRTALPGGREKAVSVTVLGTTMRIGVRVISELKVLDATNETYRIFGYPDVDVSHGRIAVTYNEPKFKWLPWPTREKTRRF